MKKLSVLVRGASGLLAQRLIATLKLLPQTNIVGIYRNDPTLDRIVEIWSITKGGIPDKLFIDGNLDLAEKISRKTGYLFMPVSEFDISNIDLVIDTTLMLEKFPQYQHYKNPVIMQDGVYPKGQLISLPLVQPKIDGDVRFRQGGCILSGVVPILYILKDHIKSVGLKIIMQEDARENDYLISERLTNIRHDSSVCNQVTSELNTIFPEVSTKVLPVTKIPGLINYQVEFTVMTKECIEKESFLELFHQSSIKRVQVLKDSISSVYTLNLAHSLPNSDLIPPIHIFSSSFQKNDSEIMFTASLYHRTLPILANIDSIFHLALGLTPLDAISKTDMLMGFN